MYLKELEVSNFKMFDNIKLEFEPGFNILLGDNGVGKTTILEAASVAISGFLTGMEDVPARNIYKQDVRYKIIKDNMGIPNKIYNTGSTQIRCLMEYKGICYEWVRAKKNSSSSSKTTMTPKDIQHVSQRLINSMNEVLPLISYQGAARHWLTTRADADVKKIKQLHDRRCGYLGCLDRKLNLNSVYDWCMQMEWNTMKLHKEPHNYKVFMKIISDFMCYMNDGAESEVIYDVNSRKLLYVEKGDCKEIEDLSAGYQSILSLIIDLAYRIAVLNPDIGDNMLEVEGIVLIDEIDSNLHPKWQWKIVDAITKIFPKVQFIAATHSPIIVSSCKNANIISIGYDEIDYIADSYAYSVNEILRDMLGYHMQPAIVEDLIEKFEHGLDEENYNESYKALKKLEKLLGSEHAKIIALKSEYRSEVGDDNDIH